MKSAAVRKAVPWRLRQATLLDLPLLVRHRDAMWVEMGRVRPGEADPTSPAYARWLAARMKRRTLTAFVIEQDGEALASGALWVQEVQPRPGHPETKWGYILSVYTEPPARRRGLARAIMAACVLHAREAGCTRCCLHASDDGRPLYEDLGFEPTAEMWLDLRPAEQRPPQEPARPRRRPGGAPRRGGPARDAFNRPKAGGRASSRLAADPPGRRPPSRTRGRRVARSRGRA